MTSATDALRALLDERGVEWWEGWDKDLTLFDGANGVRWMADYTLGELFLRSVLSVTPEQAVAATLGPAYEPSIAAHWDGDVLVLTTPRDPSSVHVQRGEGEPRRVYPAEATLGPGTCHDIHEDDGYFKCSGCGGRMHGWTEDDSAIWFSSPHFCPNCGKRVVG